MSKDDNVLLIKDVHRIGFTGTRSGMTKSQKEVVNDLLAFFAKGETYPELNNNPRILNAIHGDCIGADFDFHNIAILHGYRIIIYPCNIPKMRSYVKADEEHLPSAPLIRNHTIVNMSNLLIACPKSHKEELRSGTWATIRYAKKIQKVCVIVDPAGDIK